MNELEKLKYLSLVSKITTGTIPRNDCMNVGRLYKIIQVMLDFVNEIFWINATGNVSTVNVFLV